MGQIQDRTHACSNPLRTVVPNALFASLFFSQNATLSSSASCRFYKHSTAPSFEHQDRSGRKCNTCSWPFRKQRGKWLTVLVGLNLQGLWDSVTQSHFLFSPYRRIKCFIFFQKSLKLQNSLHSILIRCIFFSFSSLGSNYWWIYIFKRICIFFLVWNLICSCIKMSLLPREYSNKSQ